MKLLLLLVTILISGNSFADDSFDNMEISEIMNRGYLIEATVSREAGLTYYEGEIRKDITPGCSIRLRQNTQQDSVLATSSTFNLEQSLGYFDSEHILLSNNGAVNVLYIEDEDEQELTMGQLKDSCDGLSFEVVVNNGLVKL